MYRHVVDGSSPDYLCGMLGIDRPVLLAPMAHVAGGRLAAAVSDAGGLGLIGGGYGKLEWINEQLTVAGDSVVGIGFISWALDAEVLAAVLQRRPAAVWFSFGDATPHFRTVHAAGIVSICQVGSAAEATAAVAAGANVIVAQGSEAGGHGREGLSLTELLPAIRAALPKVPLVAAGGLNDATDFERVHRLGAAGVALGTAFYASEEATDVVAAKQQLVAAESGSTVRSTVYDIIRGPEWPTEFTGRSLRSDLTERWANDSEGLRKTLEVVKLRYAEAAKNDDMTKRVVWAGEGVGDVDAIVPAASIVARFPAVR